jgi:Na+-driven multidrug efflux pump
MIASVSVWWIVIPTLWVLLALAVAILARRTEHSFVGFLLLGLLGNWSLALALLIVLLVRDRWRRQRRPDLQRQAPA